MTFSVTDDHVLVPRSERGTLRVLFDDAYVWSFTTPRDGSLRPRGWKVPWPDTLRPRLVGTTSVALHSDTNGRRFEQTVRFSGSDQALALVDDHGHRLAIDGAGHLARVFSETGDDTRAQIVEGTRQALADLRADGYDAHLSYGCLLGAVRDGKMIGHDTDSDLAYISKYTHPAQIIAESYAMERSMRRRGWRMVRMSNADLKLLYPLADGRRVHIDIFGGFHVGDTFYLLGGRSGTLPREALTPAGTVTLEGVEVPAPADPEAVLAFLYGPSWRVPDPAFQNVDPPGGLRRIQGWMRGVRDDVIEWNEFVRDNKGSFPWKGSTFAKWARERIPAGAPVADIGSGKGRDTAFFLRRGHPTVSFDFSGKALQSTRRKVVRLGGSADTVRVLSLNDRRSVLVAGAELARTPEPVNLYARHLIGCLTAEGRDLLWLMASMSLRRGGKLFLEFSADSGPRPEPRELLTRVPVDVVVAEITARGGIVEDVVVEPGTGYLDEPDPRIARIVAHWPPVTQTLPEKGPS